MLDPHGALICTMVIVSAADSDMTDAAAERSIVSCLLVGGTPKK